MEKRKVEKLKKTLKEKKKSLTAHKSPLFFPLNKVRLIKTKLGGVSFLTDISFKGLHTALRGLFPR